MNFEELSTKKVYTNFYMENINFPWNNSKIQIHKLQEFTVSAISAMLDAVCNIWNENLPVL